MKCRFCGQKLSLEFVDLVNAPPSNSYLSPEGLNKLEVFHPLKLYVCKNCLLVQIDEYMKTENIFDNSYAYYSSYSKSWLAHSKKYAHMMTERFSLNKKSRVIELASNDGYLLQYFKELGIPVLGVEPTGNTAEVAVKKGIETIVDFFGVKLANKMTTDGIEADIIAGNNVLAHVPDLNDFVEGARILLKDTGVITMEFPHLMKLITNNQFDTIYHEHFSYFSFNTVIKVFEAHNLEIFDVEELETHGGSLRIYAKHKANNTLTTRPSVKKLLDKENLIGMNRVDYYLNFQSKVDAVKNKFLGFLLEQNLKNKQIIGYGAAAKGNTLLTYCGVRKDLISYVVDASPYKQGKYLPGTHLPIFSEAKIRDTKPDYVVILPWNLEKEITEQLAYIKEWGGKFVVAVPSLRVI